MSLLRVKMQDWNARFEYAPPLVDGVVNTDEVVSAFECESRGTGPWTRVTLRDGQKITIRGTPDVLIPKPQEPEDRERRTET